MNCFNKENNRIPWLSTIQKSAVELETLCLLNLKEICPLILMDYVGYAAHENKCPERQDGSANLASKAGPELGTA